MDSDYYDSEIPSQWPRFIMIESTVPDKPVTKLSHFDSHKGTRGLLTQLMMLKIMGASNFLVECVRKAHADNLPCASMLAGIAIKASHHRPLNSSKEYGDAY